MQKLLTCIIHKKFSVFMNGAQNVGCMLVNPDIDAVEIFFKQQVIAIIIERGRLV